MQALTPKQTAVELKGSVIKSLRHMSTSSDVTICQEEGLPDDSMTYLCHYLVL